MHRVIIGLSTLILVSGCANMLDDFAFRHDMQQGNVFTTAQVQELQLGMSQAEVVQILGTPTFIDPLQPNRWDYLHRFTPRRGKSTETHLVLYFDAEQKLSKIH